MTKKLERWMKKSIKERLYVLKKGTMLYMTDGKYMGYKLDLDKVQFGIIEKILLRNKDELDILAIVNMQNIKDLKILESVKNIDKLFKEDTREKVKLETINYIDVNYRARIFLKTKPDHEEVKIYIKEDAMKFVNENTYNFFQDLENDRSIIYANDGLNGIEMCQ